MINLGANRLVAAHGPAASASVLGGTMLDPNLHAPSRIVPRVHIFGDSEDPFGADVMSQEPDLGH